MQQQPTPATAPTRRNLQEQLAWLEANRSAALTHGFKQEPAPAAAPPSALPPEATAAGQKLRSMLATLHASSPRPVR